MTSDRHDRVSEIFLGAVDLPSAARAAFLDRACMGDDGLRREIEGLLAHDTKPAAVDRPVVSDELRRVLGEPEPPERQPSRIGPYEIIDVLGRGGMGTVYRARQRNPDRIVALKVVNASMVSRSALRRFEFEAHLLGRLQHPGLAQIFEAGMAEDSQGRSPYFAMELIEGRTLTDYANSNRIGIRQRLVLLKKVCEAVQHAHQKGVIHRDLKPANILVDDDGQPKILDFGIARTTDSDIRKTTLRTHVGQIIGTVPYMSPEQIAGNPDELDTRTDVYSLGVIAYELLTGRLPHDLEDTTIPEAARIIRDDNPPRLSSINRACRGDVETIVAKALEKDKEKRYAAVSDLAGDIQRFLQDEPITARPPSAIYQLRKFARRNRGLVASVAAAFVILILGVAGTSFGLVEAGRKRKLAESRLTRAQNAEAEALRKQAEAEAVSLFMLRVITTPRPDLEGREITVVEALDVARREVDSAFADQPEVRAAVHAELGATYSGLGRPDTALEHLREAYEQRRSTLGVEDPDTRVSMNNLAHALIERAGPGNLTEARTLLEKALAIHQARQDGDSPAAIAVRNNLARVHMAQGDRAGAEALTRLTLEICLEIYGDDHPSTINQMENLIYLLESEESREAGLRQILALRERVQGPEHSQTLKVRRTLADALREQGRYQDADPIYAEVIEVMNRVVGENHPETLAAMNQRAVGLFRLKRRAESATLLRATLGREREHLGPAHQLTLATTSVLADVTFRLGEYAESEALYEQLVKVHTRLSGADSPRALFLRVWRGICILELGRSPEAEALFDELRDRPSELPSSASLSALLDAGRAKLLWLQGEFRKAEALLLGSERTLRTEHGPTHLNARLSILYLTQLYSAWDNPEELAAWIKKLDP